MGGARAVLIWGALATAIAVPVAVAASSPLLAWRQPVYVAAGLAGVIAMALLLVQPLLAGGYLPGLPVRRGRRVHRVVGVALAMWAILAAALLAALRRRLSPRAWRIGHTALVAVAVATGAVHAMLIEGTMGTISKAVLCALALGATAKVVADTRV